MTNNNKQKVVAIIQARMGSSRLPGKVLEDIAGRPMLWHVVNRLRHARTINQIIVATSHNPADNAIADFCAASDLPCYRGDENDVLDRFYQAAKSQHAQTVVRITADCPFIDPEVVDQVVVAREKAQADYASNSIRYTLPEGLDTEAFTFASLEKAWKEARKPSEREHVTPYLRTSNQFRVHSVESDSPVQGEHRWSVDQPEDLEFARRVFQALVPGFGFRDVLDLIQSKPDILNGHRKTIVNEGYYKSLYDQAKAGSAPRRILSKSQAVMVRSAKVIPGCAQTFSKGPNQHVQGIAPVFLERGKGARVWDVDGNEYIDYIQGLLPNILGYAHEEVNAAAAAQLAQGHSFSLPHPLEVELAERLARLIPCAQMVRFGKNGSDATAASVRVARAFTGRERVACCGYHGWQDWYIGCTTRSTGVPAAVKALTHPFVYNDLDSLERVFSEHPQEFAAVIMEPVNFTEPKPGFLEGVKELAHRHGALLVFDEICSGFHFGLGGAQKRFGVTPDLACFGKAMGNGFPIACVVGRADVMKLFEEIFVSFTFAGEVASMAAALKVLDILETTNALACMEANGKRLQDGFNFLAKQAGLLGQLECIGYPFWSLLKFRDATGKDSFIVRSLFMQETVKRGVLLLATHNMTAAHDDATIEATLETYAAVVKTLSGWMAEMKPERFLEGEMIQPVFRVR